MRGARIAEKIQEFYNTTGPAGLSAGSQTLSGNATKGIPSRADLHSQGNSRGSKLVLVGEPGATTQGNMMRPRATSAYGTHNSRRNLNAHL